MRMHHKYIIVILLTILVMIVSTIVIPGGLYLLLKSENIIMDAYVFDVAIDLLFADVIFTYLMCFGFYHTYIKIKESNYRYVVEKLESYQNKLLGVLCLLVLALFVAPLFPIGYVFTIEIAIVAITGYAYIGMVTLMYQ